MVKLYKLLSREVEIIEKFIKSLEEIYGDSRNQVALIDRNAVVIWCNTIPLNRFEELTPGMDLSKVAASVFWADSKTVMKRGKAVRMMAKINNENFHLYIEPFIKNEEFAYSLVHIIHEKALQDSASAVAIHDLKNPVKMIMSLVKDNKNDKFEIIRHYCESAMDIIRDYSSEEDVSVMQNTDMTQFISGIFGECKTVLGNKIDVEICKCEKTLCSQIITGEIENAVINLIVNAKNHCNSYIKLELYEKDGFAVIAVENDGDTVDSSIKDRIYEPYVKASSGGSGLGLYTVKRVAEKHNGKIVLADAKRTRFELSIPLSTAVLVKNSDALPEVNTSYIRYILERENG